MAAKKKNNNLLVATITIAVVAILAWNYLGFFGKPMTTKLAQQTTPISTIKDLPTSQVPPAMPQDIILATDAQIVHSYTGMTPTGQEQSTLIYTTQQAPGTLLQQYIQYLLKNGWWPKTSPIQVVPQSQIKTPTKTNHVVVVKVATSSIQYSTTDSKASSTISVNILYNASSTNWSVSINLLSSPN